MSKDPHSRPGEASRDQSESVLTEILRELAQVDQTLLAAVFVDLTGECVDYWSVLEPFDAKVCAAHMMVITAEVVARFEKMGNGNVDEIVIGTEKYDIVIHRISDEYTLVLVREPGERERALLEGVDRAAQRLRRDASIPPPSWERAASVVHVRTRKASVWPYVPATFMERGTQVRVIDVLGRWETDGQVCFRVRTDDGRELTVAHDATESLWSILKDEG